ILFSLPFLFVIARSAATKQSQKQDCFAPKCFGARNDTEKSFATTPEIVSPRMFRGTHRTTYFWLLLILFLALAQLNIALLPPFEYDALEYHFGAPDYYLQQHKITSVPGNVYANFPANTEMLYLLGMLFRNDVTGKLFHFYFGILTALGLFAIGKKFWSETTGAIAAVVFLAFPIIFQLNYQANIDLALAGYSVLAFFAFLNWSPNLSGKEKNRADLILSSLFIGLGLGCKYTAMLTMAIPLFILILIHLFIARKDEERRTKPLLVAGRGWILVPKAFGIGFWIFLLVFPWCIKNFIFTGNPIFPLFYNLFGGYGWTPELATKFMNAHLSFNFIKPFYQDYSRITMLTLLILVIPLRNNKNIRDIFLYLLFGYLFWFFLTEHIERFLMPILPLVALGLSFLIFQYLRHQIIKYSLSAIVVIVILFLGIKLTPLLPPAGLAKPEWRRQILLDTKLSIYPAYEYINSVLPETAQLLFIGEARRHLLTRPATMNTVFDRCLIFELAKSAKSPEQIYTGLREMNITHILFNPYELDRLTKFYGPYFNWETIDQQVRFAAFFDNYTQEEWNWYDIKIYRLK
ncbi:MAG: glycosyltransferase family 39 protein, partial [bacterium]|nr:glycosyltransferase family 39 protein [bacterium]